MCTLEKIGLFGIGVLVLTQEKLEKMTQEMVKKGSMNKEEGKKYVLEVLSEKDKRLEEIEIKINQKVKDTLEKSGIATKKDIEDIKKRFDALKMSLANLEV